MLQCNMEAFMREDAKRPSASHAPASSFGSLLLGWAQQGVDSFLATQRILADFATRRSVSAMKSLREEISDSEHSPGAILTELAVEATANLTEAQRVLLNLAQQENEIVMAGVKERVAGSDTALDITDRVRRGIDTFIEMQQEFLTIASKHTQKRLRETKAGKGPDMSCLMDAAREAMEHFIKAQKKFLDIVVEEEGKAKVRHEEGARKKTEVSKIAREASSSLIDAQKKLLDLAGQQVNVNVQAASRAVDLVNSIRPTGLPSFSGEGIKKFVNAEKELLDSLIKPGNGTKAKAERRVKRPPRRRPATAQSAQAGA